ncbi:MAG: hypothetical protein M3004_13305 [Bacteroidota bacterium]|nr:hypothetical protein [Bacteroidota bacterium]
MTSTHKVPKKITAILAIVFLLPALYIFGIWFKIFNLNSDLNQAEKISAFTAHFPSGLNDIKMITYLSIACCIVAMVLAAKSFKQPIIFLRVSMFITVFVAALILVLDVSQMM